MDWMGNGGTETSHRHGYRQNPKIAFVRWREGIVQAFLWRRGSNPVIRMRGISELKFVYLSVLFVLFVLFVIPLADIKRARHDDDGLIA